MTGHDKVKLICQNCQTEFIVNWNKRRQTCCSRSCATSYRGGWTNHSKVNWSEVNKRSYQTGKNFVAGGTTKWIVVACSDRTLKVQGSYEAKACRILDEAKLSGMIKNWEYAKNRIQYIGSDSKKHTYIIDFTVTNLDDTITYVEVKGRTTITDLLKWEALRKIGTLAVWTKEILDKKKWARSVVGNISDCHFEDCGFDPRGARTINLLICSEKQSFIVGYHGFESRTKLP